jgi:hypothetical protein
MKMANITRVFKTLGLILFCSFSSNTILASSHSEHSDKTVLNMDYFASPRSDAMSGAISTTANGIDSTFYNPAAIGGIFWGAKRLPFVRQLHFPFIGASANDNAQSLWGDLSNTGGENDPTIAEALVDANEDKRQYARFSSGVYTEIFRMAILIHSDIQFAALNPSDTAVDPDTNSNILDINYHSTTGTGIGVSGSTSNENIYFGVFVNKINKKIYNDHITYDELITSDQREKLLSSESSTYTGLSTNAGVLWRMGKKLRPVLAIVARGVGDTNLRYKSGKSPDSGAQDTYDMNRDITLGFSISPKLFGGELNLALDARYLNQDNLNLEQKLFSGLEYSYGGIGSEALVAIRLGASAAGLSGGFKIGTGLLNLEAAVSKVDISNTREPTIEQRRTILFNVNVRDM